MTKPVPSNNPPFADDNGRVSQPWFYFLQSLSGPGEPIAAITLGASPFDYTANSNGNVIVSDGTVSAITLTRGITVIILPFTSGVVPVRQGDIVEVTYSVLPTINFVPG